MNAEAQRVLNKGKLFPFPKPRLAWSREHQDHLRDLEREPAEPKGD